MGNSNHSKGFAASPDQAAGLRPQCLGFKEILGASLGGMGLSGTVIIGAPVVIAKGSSSSALIFLASMFAFLLVAAQINVFARKIATHGSLYVYVKMVFGAKIGAVAGWGLMLAYVTSIPAYLMTIPYTLINLLHRTGGMGPPEQGELAITAAVVAGLAAWLAIRNVTISTRAILAVDVISLSLLAFVVIQYWPGLGVLLAGFPNDQDNIRHFLAGLPLAMVCFTGIEAACVFGVEAKHPLTQIPKAIWITVLISGVVTFAASGALIGILYTLPSGYDNDPFTALINASHVWWGLPILLAAAALSWFGCLLTCFNIGGRLLYTLAQQGQLWRGFGRIHPRYETPLVAIGLIAITGMAVTTGLILYGVTIMDIPIGTATVAAPGILLSYALVSAAAVLDRWRNAKTIERWAYALTGALAVVLMLFPIVGLMAGWE